MIQHASERLKQSKKVIIEAVSQNGRALLLLEGWPQSDKDIIHEAVKQTGEAFCFAADELKKDEQIALAAIESNVLAYQWVFNDLKQQIPSILKAVQRNSKVYDKLSHVFQLNIDVWIAAIENDHSFFNKMPRPMWEIKYSMHDLLKKNGLILQYLSITEIDDINLVRTSFQQNVQALQFASEAIRDNNVHMLEFIGLNPYAILFASERLLNDMEFLQSLRTTHPELVEEIDPNDVNEPLP